MKPDAVSGDPVGAEGPIWGALLANLNEDDRQHAEQRVRQSIAEDRSRALSWDEEPPPEDNVEDNAADRA